MGDKTTVQCVADGSDSTCCSTTRTRELVFDAQEIESRRERFGEESRESKHHVHAHVQNQV